MSLLFTPRINIFNTDNYTCCLVIRLALKAHCLLLIRLQGIRLSTSEAWVPDWAGILPDQALNWYTEAHQVPDRARSFGKWRQDAALEQIKSTLCDHFRLSETWIPRSLNVSARSIKAPSSVICWGGSCCIILCYVPDDNPGMLLQPINKLIDQL